MPIQTIKIIRAPEQPPVDLIHLRAWLCNTYPKSEWMVEEIQDYSKIKDLSHTIKINDEMGG